MAARSKEISERFALTVRISSCDLSYHIAQSQEREFSEILAFEMLATIETIHPKFKRHLGEDLQVSLTDSGRVSHNAYRESDANMIHLIDLRAQVRAQGVRRLRSCKGADMFAGSLRDPRGTPWAAPCRSQTGTATPVWRAVSAGPRQGSDSGFPSLSSSPESRP